MRLPRVRFTVRRMMVVIATLAVSWPMFVGIGHLTIYRANLQSEAIYREAAATLQVERKDDLAADWRRRAEETAQMNRETWSHVVTLSVLVGLGIILGGLGLMLRTRYGSVSSARPVPVNAVAAVCSAGMKIVFAGLILGGIAYVGLLLLVLAGDD